MAPTQKKLKEFFEGRRREAVLDDWRPLKSAGGEMRFKLLVRMPLLNHDLQGVPEEISKAFQGLAEDESPINSSKLNILYDGMTVEFFTDDSAKLPWTNGKEGVQGGLASVTGVLFDKFALIAKGKGEKRTVDLVFIAYVSATQGMKDWTFENLHGTVFMEAVYSQSEMGEEFMREDPDRKSEAAVEEEDEEEESPQLTLAPAGNFDEM